MKQNELNEFLEYKKGFMAFRIKNKFRSFLGLLVVTIFITSLVPALLNYAFDFYLIFNNAIQIAHEESRIHAEDILVSAEHHFNSAEKILVFFSKHLGDLKTKEEVATYIHSLKENFLDFYFRNIYIVDREGKFFVSTFEEVTLLAGSKIPKELLKDGTFISDFTTIISEEDRYPLIVQPLQGRWKDYYLVGELEIYPMSRLMEKKPVETYILDRFGNGYHFQQKDFSIVENFEKHEIIKKTKDMNVIERLTCDFVYNHRGIKVYSCITGSSKYPFYLVTEINEDKILGMVKFQILRTLIVFLSLGIIIFYIVYRIAKRFIKPIADISTGLEEMEREKGLNLKLDTKTGIKETDQLIDKFNVLLEKINFLIQDIRSTANNIDELFLTVKNSTSTLEKVSVDLSAILEENSASLEEINSSMQDIERIGKKNYDSAKEIQDIVQSNLTRLHNLNKNLQELSDISNSTADYTKQSKDKASELKDMIYKIQETSERITEILSIIKEISDRTNLLSLNASIEAARAGESGKGFAVVAQSISNLAETTEKSVKDIEDLIEQTTYQMAQAIEFIDKSSDMMHRSYDMVSSLNEKIMNSKSLIEEQLKNSNKIYETSNKLASTATDTFNSIKFVKNVISEIHKSIEQASSVSLQFTEISRRLNEVIAKLDEDAQKLRLQIKRFSSS